MMKPNDVGNSVENYKFPEFVENKQVFQQKGVKIGGNVKPPNFSYDDVLYHQEGNYKKNNQNPNILEKQSNKISQRYDEFDLQSLAEGSNQDEIKHLLNGQLIQLVKMGIKAVRIKTGKWKFLVKNHAEKNGYLFEDVDGIFIIIYLENYPSSRTKDESSDFDLESMTEGLNENERKVFLNDQLMQCIEMGMKEVRILPGKWKSMVKTYAEKNGYLIEDIDGKAINFILS